MDTPIALTGHLLIGSGATPGGQSPFKGIDPSTWDYYMAYNLFRIAGITQGIAKRVVDGTAASEYAREAGSRTRPLAELGWAQVERILKRTA